jgi:hypothetical protein
MFKLSPHRQRGVLGSKRRSVSEKVSTPSLQSTRLLGQMRDRINFTHYSHDLEGLHAR